MFECITQLSQRYSLSHGTTPPRAYAVYLNSQFGVTRDRVVARPLAFYESLLAEFERIDGPETSCFTVSGPKAQPHRGTCALFEYLWPTIMGETPILDPRRTMSGIVAPHTL